MRARHDRKAFQYINFNGSNNIFKLYGCKLYNRNQWFGAGK